MGSENGCDYGNYCIDAFYDSGDFCKCPGICPAVCDWELETTQDNGYDPSGCWLGNHCVPLDSTGTGSTSDGVCPETSSIECSEDQMTCYSGYDDNGCALGAFCTDLSYPSYKDPEVSCPGMCGASCNWENETYCDNGFDGNGCWMGNYCVPMYTPDMNGEDTCYAACPLNCNWDTEVSCDMGVDDDGCWMGNYCASMADGCPVETTVSGDVETSQNG